MKLTAGTKARNACNKRVVVPCDMDGTVVSQDDVFVCVRGADGELYFIDAEPPPLPKPKRTKKHAPRKADVALVTAAPSGVPAARWMTIGWMLAVATFGSGVAVGGWIFGG